MAPRGVVRKLFSLRGAKCQSLATQVFYWSGGGFDVSAGEGGNWARPAPPMASYRSKDVGFAPMSSRRYNLKAAVCVHGWYNVLTESSNRRQEKIPRGEEICSTTPVAN